MKKANIINLIKFYSEGNDSAFRNEAYQIANEFDRMGDYQLSEYIMALLSNANTFVPQYNDNSFNFIKKIELNEDPLPLPDVIKTENLGVVNTASNRIGVNKF